MSATPMRTRKQKLSPLTILPPLFTPRPTFSPSFTPHRPKNKVIVVMGATGTGKSQLSLDLAAHFPAEIINCDKMQVYRGLPVLTNKVTPEENKSNVVHHLLGTVHDPESDFTASDFCFFAARAVESISDRGRTPIIVGGSNSFIEALVEEQDRKIGLKFEFCFVWIDVNPRLLHSSVSKRVEAMVELGLVDEARSAFDPDANYSVGIRRSIGVPEFDKYFRDGKERKDYLREAIESVKENTIKLTMRQTEKIRRLKEVKGWKVHRIDASHVFRKRDAGEEGKGIWEKNVVGPSVMIVRQFMNAEDYYSVGKCVVPTLYVRGSCSPSSARRMHTCAIDGI